ncbi:tetratricopeptide repeat protein [Marinimicrobium sp. C6131]|uniref:YfgM family protein n=1 Tax=Marinimicrobium sp. C6131 TaxID=3022676 RepID=UPI00223D063F|nr:tetratricopeptide repeat protein [Marinimicrobium sp. C6131]UZJ45130.1 tetratricopeptide repeat protein [Marinimicrobium sp. C6131]
MSDHLTEEEQLEALKRWWKENGKWIVAAVVVAVGGYFGWTTYQDRQQAEAEAGSAIYSELLDTLAVEEGSAVSDDDRARATELVTQLKTEHANSAYGANAALIRARWAVDENDLETAEGELRWVLEQETSEAVRQLARLRLARVLSAGGQLDDALATLEAESPADSIAAEYAEARGDILSKQGDNEGAAQAYQSALDSLDAQQQNRVLLLQMKLDNVQPAAASDASGTEENAS